MRMKSIAEVREFAQRMQEHAERLRDANQISEVEYARFLMELTVTLALSETRPTLQ
jgi:hypothetical protein